VKRLASLLGDRSALYWARHHHGVRSNEVSMAWARRDDEQRQLPRGDDNYESGGTATRWSERSVKIDDNYRGRDDNYPRVVVKTGAWDERKNGVGTGRNSCR
jgi:hypothetical protein